MDTEIIELESGIKIRRSLTTTEPDLEQQLRTVLSEYETKSGKMFTLTFKEIGTSKNPAVIGDAEERKCKWRVEVGSMRPPFDYEYFKKSHHEDLGDADPFSTPTIPTEPALLELNGVYDSYEAIREAITKIRLDNAHEMYILGKSCLKSWRKTATGWETTCGKCNTTVDNWCATTLCQHCKGYDNLPLVPDTFLNSINVEDGKIIYNTGGSVNVVTFLGKIIKA